MSSNLYVTVCIAVVYIALFVFCNLFAVLLDCYHFCE